MRALILAVSVALTPLPVAAADTARTPAARNLRASMARIVSHDRRTAVTPAVKPGAAQDNYALYSAQHDRIHSPGKK